MTSARSAVAAMVAVSAVAVLTAAPRAGAAADVHPDPLVRVALATSATSASVGATGPWRVYAADGRTLLYRPSVRDRWRFDAVAGRVRGSSQSGFAMAGRTGGVLLRTAAPGDLLTFNGKQYRGELAILPAGGALLVVNRLGLESYLRGVVPLEIGKRLNAEMAAVKAQAVAARSYAHTHIRMSALRPYDLVGTVMNQVYGGVAAETPLTDAAIEETRGVVLHYAGSPVDGQYHASCGGRTAAAGEVYAGSADRPYLRSVSDRIPGSDAHYCDIYPRAVWSRTMDARQVSASVRKYLRELDRGSSAPAVGDVRAIEETGRTASGRVAGLRIRTSRATHVVRGNAIRFAIRSPNGEILPSTYFSARAVRDARGDLTRVVLTGRGNGHGVGMCQWGAIGRARAGESWQSILRTYYPGTELETIY